MDILKDNAQLNQVCLKLSEDKIIGIDTEFTRRKTYFAKLSLIQIYSNKVQVIIDAQSPRINLQIFNEAILKNPNIVKIIHSGRQDFEIFYHLYKTIPINVFDTQIAAKICGLGAHLSYSKLCEITCQKIIDKTHQKADWSQRPLSEDMLNYAIEDVKYLEQIYNFLLSQLHSPNLLEQYASALKNELLNTNIYHIDPSKVWEKLKLPHLPNFIISRMKIIAAFREECAISEDLPKTHVATDQDLILICRHLPTSYNALKNLNLQNKVFLNNKWRDNLMNLCIGLKEAAAYGG